MKRRRSRRYDGSSSFQGLDVEFTLLDFRYWNDLNFDLDFRNSSELYDTYECSVGDPFTLLNVKYTEDFEFYWTRSSSLDLTSYDLYDMIFDLFHDLNEVKKQNVTDPSCLLLFGALFDMILDLLIERNDCKDERRR